MRTIMLVRTGLGGYYLHTALGLAALGLLAMCSPEGSKPAPRVVATAPVAQPAKGTTYEACYYSMVGALDKAYPATPATNNAVAESACLNRP